MNIYNPEVIETTRHLRPRAAIARASSAPGSASHQATHPCLVAVNDEDDLGELGARGERILGFAVGLTLSRPSRLRHDRRELGLRPPRGPRARRGRATAARADRDGQGSRASTRIIARIVGENAGSIRSHEKCGFTLVGTEIEVGRKHGRWLDVVEYQYVVCADAAALGARARGSTSRSGQDHWVQRPMGTSSTPPRIATRERDEQRVASARGPRAAGVRRAGR